MQKVVLSVLLFVYLFCLFVCEITLGHTGFCRIFATELEDRRPKTVPYLEEVVE